MPTHPSIVFIIRHAEKPDDPADPHLSAKGVQRAKALPGYSFPPLAAVFAARDSHQSSRPVETVTPLVAMRDATFRTDIKDDEYPRLAAELLLKDFDSKAVLVCWHHGNIPQLAKALGAAEPKPDPWPTDQFDRLYVLSWNSNDSVNFENRPQHLLEGDSTNVID